MGEVSLCHALCARICVCLLCCIYIHANINAAKCEQSRHADWRAKDRYAYCVLCRVPPVGHTQRSNATQRNAQHGGLSPGPFPSNVGTGVSRYLPTVRYVGRGRLGRVAGLAGWHHLSVCGLVQSVHRLFLHVQLRNLMHEHPLQRCIPHYRR